MELTDEVVEKEQLMYDWFAESFFTKCLTDITDYLNHLNNELRILCNPNIRDQGSAILWFWGHLWPKCTFTNEFLLEYSFLLSKVREG